MSASVVSVEGIGSRTHRNSNTVKFENASNVQENVNKNSDDRVPFFKTALLDAGDSQNNGLKLGSSKSQSLPPIVDVRLPVTVNVVAVRETMFAEAPFVNKNNKLFWRRMVDSKQFTSILAASYNFIVGCIAESGYVNNDKLSDIANSPLVAVIADNLSDIFYTFKRLDRDLLLCRLPEVITFMLIQSMQTALPRHHRVYNAIKFRELVIDWCTELIWGMRLTNSHTNREWVFKEALDINIITISSIGNSKDSGSGRDVTPKGVNNDDYNNKMKHGKSNISYSQAVSEVSMSHSPLVKMFIDANKTEEEREKPPRKNFLALNMKLSHTIDRPLFNLVNGSGITKLGKPREKLMDSATVKFHIKHVKSVQKTIANAYSENKEQEKLGLREVFLAKQEKLHEIDETLKSSLPRNHRRFHSTNISAVAKTTDSSQSSVNSNNINNNNNNILPIDTNMERTTSGDRNTVAVDSTSFLGTSSKILESDTDDVLNMLPTTNLESVIDVDIPPSVVEINEIS